MEIRTVSVVVWGFNFALLLACAVLVGMKMGTVIAEEKYEPLLIELEAHCIEVTT